MDILKILIFFSCSLITLYFAEKISVKFNFYDLPDKKKIHKKKVTKVAGLALIPIIALNLVFLDLNYQLFYFMLFLILCKTFVL